MEKKEVITQLLKNGATEVKNLKVKNVTVRPQENWVRLGITLDREVTGMVSEDNGVTYKEGKTNVIFVSLYSIASLLKDNDEAAFAANHIVEHPESINVLMSRATIDIIQEPVAEAQVYKNPWSNSDEATTFTHDTYINHVVDIKLSDFGKSMLVVLAKGMLGI